MNFKKSLFLSLMLLCLVSQAVHANEAWSRTEKAFVEIGTAKLSEMVAKNAQNVERGVKGANRYVLDLTGDLYPSDPVTVLKAQNSDIKTNSKVVSAMNADLNSYYQETDVEVYVMIYLDQIYQKKREAQDVKITDSEFKAVFGDESAKEIKDRFTKLAASIFNNSLSGTNGSKAGYATLYFKGINEDEVVKVYRKRAVHFQDGIFEGGGLTERILADANAQSSIVANSIFGSIQQEVINLTSAISSNLGFEGETLLASAYAKTFKDLFADNLLSEEYQKTVEDISNYLEEVSFAYVQENEVSNASRKSHIQRALKQSLQTQIAQSQSDQEKVKLLKAWQDQLSRQIGKEQGKVEAFQSSFDEENKAEAFWILFSLSSASIQELSATQKLEMMKFLVLESGEFYDDVASNAVNTLAGIFSDRYEPGKNKSGLLCDLVESFENEAPAEVQEVVGFLGDRGTFLKLFSQVDEKASNFNNYSRLNIALARLAFIKNGENPDDYISGDKLINLVTNSLESFDEGSIRTFIANQERFKKVYSNPSIRQIAYHSDDQLKFGSEGITQVVTRWDVKHLQQGGPGSTFVLIKEELGEVEVGYDDLVLVTFLNSSLRTTVCNDCNAGTAILVPAFFLDYINRTTAIEENIDNTLMVVEVASLFIGVGEFTMAYRAGKTSWMAIAAADILFSSIGLALEEDNVKKAVEEHFGPDVLKVLQATTAIGSIATGGLSLTDLAKSSKGVSNAMKASNIEDALSKVHSGNIPDEVLKTCEKMGFDTDAKAQEFLSAMLRAGRGLDEVEEIGNSILSAIKVNDDAIDLLGRGNDINDFFVKADKIDGYVDVIIHGEGKKFLVNGNAYEGDLLASFLNGTGSLADQDIRLLTCSNLESAREFAKAINKGSDKQRKVIATDQPVIAFSDGSLKTINENEAEWVELIADRAGEISQKSVAQPRAPSAETQLQEAILLGRTWTAYPKLNDLSPAFKTKLAQLIPDGKILNKLEDDLGKDQNFRDYFLKEVDLEQFGAKLGAWNDFFKSKKPHARWNTASIESYLKLNKDSKAQVLRFSDASKSKSTLNRFLADCDETFLGLINKEPKFLECFLGHKADPKWTLDQYASLAEEIADNQSYANLEKKLSSWIDHSSEVSKFGRVTQKGIDFNKNVVTAIRSGTGKLFEDLANFLSMKPNLLSKYEVYAEVPLITEGGYMKADLVLILRNGFDNSIEEVILIENKLSLKTDYTIRQKEAWKKLANNENLQVMRNKNELGEDVDGQLLSTESLHYVKTKLVRISSDGEVNPANTFLESIPIQKYISYEYTGAK